MERPTSSDMMPKRDNERDVELDKKIEALRRKNEALMKRYKEVEEDKKRAEEEGMALQSRKGKADDLTITISKSTSDSRVVVTKPFSSGSAAGKVEQEAGPVGVGEGPSQGAGRGHRKQLTVTMEGKKGKRVVSEKPERRPGSTDVKSPTDDGQAKRVESSGRGKHPPHTTKRNTAAAAAQSEKAHYAATETRLARCQEKVKVGEEDEMWRQTKKKRKKHDSQGDEVKLGQRDTQEHTRLPEQSTEPESPHGSTDLDIPTLREEQQEYLKWKREREQIDKERVARHKNAKGQWRRAWDMDKSESMFSDKSLPDRDWGHCSRAQRNTRRGQPKANMDPRGFEKRGKDKGNKNVRVMSSKAKGKDRLTGRARRWQAGEEGDNLQISDTTLEEFLEELDALTDAEAEELKAQDAKSKQSPSADMLSTSEEVSGSTDPGTVSEDTSTQERQEASSPRSSEKKVRFSEELIQGAHMRQSAGSQDSESRSQSSLKAPSPVKNKVQGPQQVFDSTRQDDGTPQDQGGGLSAAPVASQQASESECMKKDSDPPAARTSSSPPAEKASASPREFPVQPVELAKCNISNANTEELIDSGLSVLSLESGETHPTHCTSSDKAREHGKIV